MTWRNNGLMVHTIVAQDGSWTTGPLNPADVGGVTFDKPGNYAYMCKEHPWVVGQIVVTVGQGSKGEDWSKVKGKGQKSGQGSGYKVRSAKSRVGEVQGECHEIRFLGDSSCCVGVD